MSAADPERQSAGGIHNAGSEPETLPETYETDETPGLIPIGEVVSPDDLTSGLTSIIGNAVNTAREFGGRAGQLIISLRDYDSGGEKVLDYTIPDSEYVGTSVEVTEYDGSRRYRVKTKRGALIVGGAALLGVTIATAAAHRRRRK